MSHAVGMNSTEYFIAPGPPTNHRTFWTDLGILLHSYQRRWRNRETQKQCLHFNTCIPNTRKKVPVLIFYLLIFLFSYFIFWAVWPFRFFIFAKFTYLFRGSLAAGQGTLGRRFSLEWSVRRHAVLSSPFSMLLRGPARSPWNVLLRVFYQ